MLGSTIWILLLGFFGGQLARRLGAPPLLGMLLVGVLLGPEVANLLVPAVLDAANALRTVAVMVILVRAGLGLDREKLIQQGSVALRLGCLPVLLEAIAIALAAMVLFQFDGRTGLLLGCIVSAESPAVIVPGMLRLKRLGFGVAKGIPDAILTGSALSDVLVLLVFSLLLNLFTQGTTASSAWLIPVQAISQICLGALLGYFVARLVIFLLVRQQVSQTVVHDLLITACLALLMVVLAERLPYYSGYLAAMALGFFLMELDPPLARRLRIEFNHLWVVAEIVLFVLMGASLQLQVLRGLLLPGLLLLAIGLLFGRSLGWFLATLGSNWTLEERLFLLPGNSAKATVQAAIGAMPLAAGVPGGDVMLAIAALSILTTAPLGAWAIPTFAPRLLSQDPVDPTKVAVEHRPRLMAAVDTSDLAPFVLAKTAELARQTNGDVVVVHVVHILQEDELQDLTDLVQRQLLDIRYQFLTLNGPIAEAIVAAAQHYHATDIIMGKRDRAQRSDSGLGSLSQDILAASPVPVIFVKQPTQIISS